MVTEREIYQAANTLVEQFGQDAALIHAAQRIDELGGQGDVEGERVWRQIRKAILTITRSPAPDDVLN